MAKQRPQPKLKARTLAGATGRRQPVPARDSRPPRPPAAAPGHRSSHSEAVARYEKGLEALQRHDYGRAVERFRSLVTEFPDEKDLLDRVRLYLSICERHAAPKAAVPRTVEERLYASTLAFNGGNYDEAIAQLRLVRDEDPDNDHALYMLAVAHAQRGDHAEAVAHLERSIALNPQNRALARRDSDLELLRDDEAFQSALNIRPLHDSAERRGLRPRTAR